MPPSSSSSSSSSSCPRDLVSASKLIRIPGTNELVAAPFSKKKSSPPRSSSPAHFWESTSSAAANEMTSNFVSPLTGSKKLVRYSVNAPRNLSLSLRPAGKQRSAAEAQRERARAEREEAQRAADASSIASGCDLKPLFLTTAAAFALASERAARVSSAAPTNGGVLTEAAKVARGVVRV